MRGKVAFIADSLDNAYGFQRVLSKLGVEIRAGSTMQARRLLGPEEEYLLVIFEARGNARMYFSEIKLLVEERKCPFLVIADEPDVTQLQLPASVPCDFIVSGAPEIECWARTKRLLGDIGLSSEPRMLVVESMNINLDTYQVSVAGEPIDFTYLEYALLAFFVQHADHTFTRDALLGQVWGRGYYGGSRTVDVHVRRIRSKLGPHLAHHLETVRGVGYLWSSA